jgi:hypothetical protein
MFALVATPSAEVELRSLSPDDTQAACDIYPFTTDFVCVPPSTPQTGVDAGVVDAGTADAGVRPHGSSCAYGQRIEHSGGSIVALFIFGVLHLRTRRRRATFSTFVYATAGAPAQTGEMSWRKKPYEEGVANHFDPESCVGLPERAAAKR